MNPIRFRLHHKTEIDHRCIELVLVFIKLIWHAGLVFVSRSFEKYPSEWHIRLENLKTTDEHGSAIVSRKEFQGVSVRRIFFERKKESTPTVLLI